MPRGARLASQRSMSERFQPMARLPMRTGTGNRLAAISVYSQLRFIPIVSSTFGRRQISSFILGILHLSKLRDGVFRSPTDEGTTKKLA